MASEAEVIANDARQYITALSVHNALFIVCTLTKRMDDLETLKDAFSQWARIQASDMLTCADKLVALALAGEPFPFEW